MNPTEAGPKCSAPRAAVGGARSTTRAPPGRLPVFSHQTMGKRAGDPCSSSLFRFIREPARRLTDVPGTSAHLTIRGQIEPVLLHTRGSSSLAEHSHPGSADRHRSKKKHGRPHGVLIVAKRARPAPPPPLATQARARRSAGTSAEKVQSAARPRSRFKMRSVAVVSAMGFGSGPRTSPLASPPRRPLFSAVDCGQEGAQPGRPPEANHSAPPGRGRSVRDRADPAGSPANARTGAGPTRPVRRGWR